MLNSSRGNMDFCPACRRTLDSLLATHDPEEDESGIYIEIDPEKEPPSNHLILPLCDSCRVMAKSEAGNIDGFIVVFP